MSSYPLFIIGGGAGSGKDTVAEMLVHRRRGAMIAQADPMKRFVQQGFGFTSVQLWGPSSSRNAPDERFAADAPQAFSDASAKIFFTDLAEIWLNEIGAPGAFQALRTWFDNLREAYLTKPLTPRATLQLLGTEFGRAVSPDIWSQRAISYSDALLRGGYSYDKENGVFKDAGNPGHNFVVITDGRFRNEILNVKSLGGKAIQIVNPADQADQAKVEAAGVKGHASEAELKGIPRNWYDRHFVNDKTLGLEVCRQKVTKLALTLGVATELEIEESTR